MRALRRYKALSLSGWSLDVTALEARPEQAKPAAVVISDAIGPMAFVYDMTPERAREMARHLIACADALEGKS